ncbi:MAG: hypothetical protein A2V67_00935 [Deltaproteobacteria bacterium RBG_13_61_14]|nr:MAG: hypothetical protein A2V67_00935 [Deltaproteobacteria bacterium RBG_13_61_14]
MSAGWLRTLRVGAWLLVFGLLVPAQRAQGQEQRRPFYQFFSQQKKKEKPVPPPEQLFDKAMSYYQGRETWFRRALPFRHHRRTGELRSWAVRHNYPKAIKLFQDLVTHYPYSRYAPLAELRIADCKFAMEDWEEAAVGYEDFIKFHPVHPEIAYATFRLGQCHYHQRLKYPRDQTETIAALTRFQIVQTRYPASPYAAEAAPLAQDCLKRLARHEMYVGDFYFHQKQYWASAMRYAVIPESYPEAGFTDQALFQEARSYDRLQRSPEAVERYQRVVDEFPQSRYAPGARSRLQALQVSP